MGVKLYMVLLGEDQSWHTQSSWDIYYDSKR